MVCLAILFITIAKGPSLRFGISPEMVLLVIVLNLIACTSLGHYRRLLVGALLGNSAPVNSILSVLPTDLFRFVADLVWLFLFSI